jgi:hypothetical protein
MSDHLVDAIESGVQSMLGEINTAMPGRIVSYDPATNRAVVQPSLPKMLADGTPLPAPTIAEVPVLWPAIGGAVFTMPVRPGDEVWLQFSQRSLDQWLGGDDSAPNDPRSFDLSDAVAIPGLRRDLPPVDPDAVVLQMGGAAIRIEPGGLVRIIGNLMVEGGIISTLDTVAGGISLMTHRHTETGSITQVPLP